MGETRDVLYFLNASFLENDRRAALDWIDRLAGVVAARGFRIIRFSPVDGKLHGTRLVHVFSRGEPETWSMLRRAVPRIVVTPAAPGDGVPGALEVADGVTGKLVRLGRAAIQRRWPPVDEQAFFGVADHYAVTTGEWENQVRRRWGVAETKVMRLAANSEGAAKQLADLYETLL